MSKTIAGWSLSDAVADPRSFFSHPSEVVRMEEISTSDKTAILESWKKLEELEAEVEGHGGGSSGTTLVPTIDRALKQLK